MGGIFNTPGTLAIIQVLNQAHERTNFRTLSNDAGYIQDLQTSVGTLSTYNLCVKHRLITADPTFNNRWNTWLNYFDAHGGGNIRNQMATALSGGTHSGIEFFAIPSESFNLAAFDFADGETGKNTLVVTAYTPTYDNLP